MKFSKLPFDLFLSFIIIAIIALFAFGRTLGSYFLEDDFGEVYYVSQIFAGNWQRVIDNFTGNFMQIPTMNVYRPCLLLSIMADYAIWKTNAFGYFLTNMVFLIAAAMMLYLLLRQLTSSWMPLRSIGFALLSAVLFVASPLHCESVSLMVGRVDVICLFFFLLSLWAFVRYGSNFKSGFLLLGLISFWIALLTKEMAVTLPPMLTAIAFLFPNGIGKQLQKIGSFADQNRNEYLYERIKSSLYLSYPAWISLVVYFIIRRLALGTFVGGYVGSIGAAQSEHILEKWTDLDTISRILFPFNLSVFGPQNIYHSLFSIIYFVILVLIVFRVVLLGLPRKWLILLIVWIVASLLPIYKLWGLGLNLEGARFLFFLTIPMAIFLPALLFAPTASSARSTGMYAGSQNKALQLITILSGVVLSGLAIVQVAVASKNNIPWVHAGRQTKSLLIKGQQLAQSLGQNEKVIIFGIPKEIDGAHVIYNGFTFNLIMSPPFAPQNLAHHFITFDPVFFGNAELINTERFKQELLRADLAGCYVWRPNNLRFEPLKYLPSASGFDRFPRSLTLSFPRNDVVMPYTDQRGLWQVNKDGVDILQCGKGAGVVTGTLDVNPLTSDFLEMEAIIEPPIKSENITAFWHGDNQVLSNQPEAHFLPNNEKKSPDGSCVYRAALSRYWRWFAEGEIKRIGIEFPSSKSVVIKSIKLVPADQLVPRLTVLDRKPDNMGIYSFGKNGLMLRANAEKIDNSSAIKVELSKPSYFFANLSEDNTAVLSSMIINGNSGTATIAAKAFPASAFYQIRSVALKKDGIVAGNWSEPITVKFDAAGL